MKPPFLNRREFIKRSALVGAGGLLASHLHGAPHIAGSDKLRFGLIGCGGRGTGAVADALVADPGVELVALADLFPDTLESALIRVRRRLDLHLKDDAAVERIMNEQVKVKPEWCFSGWDNHEKLCSLPDLHYIVTATPPVFRPLVVETALKNGKHMFLEKPLAVDATGIRRMYELGELADEKGISVVTGTQRRYHAGYVEAFERVRDGQIGEIVSAQASWLHGSFIGVPLRGAKNLPPADMEYQVRNWMLYIWGSGDSIVEQHIHNMDVVNWFTGKTPETAVGFGARAIEYDTQNFGDRFTHFAIEFDYGDGLLCNSLSSQQPETHRRISERLQGTKGSLLLTPNEMIITGSKPWQFNRTPGFVSEFVLEHRALIDSIRNGKPVNDIPQTTDSNLAVIAGRTAAYTGKMLKTDWVRQRSQENFLPETLAFGQLPIPEVPVPGKRKLV